MRFSASKYWTRPASQRAGSGQVVRREFMCPARTHKLTGNGVQDF